MRTRRGSLDSEKRILRGQACSSRATGDVPASWARRQNAERQKPYGTIDRRWQRLVSRAFVRPIRMKVPDVSQATAAFLERRINEETEQGGDAGCVGRACRPDRVDGCCPRRHGQVCRQLAFHGRQRLEERHQRTLLARHGLDARDRRGRGWRWQGDLGVLELELSGGIIDSATYPDAFSRLWAALRSPFGGDVLLSPPPGYELVDWGGATHIPGGSHGSLLAGDSLAPLLTVGLQGDRPSRDQWAISDVADLALAHFGLGSARSGRTPGAPA